MLSHRIAGGIDVQQSQQAVPCAQCFVALYVDYNILIYCFLQGLNFKLQDFISVMEHCNWLGQVIIALIDLQ